MRQNLNTDWVLIIDDCRLFRENLAAVLAVNGTMVAGQAWDLPSLVQAFQEENAGVVLLNMATWDRDLLLRAAFDLVRDARVIVFGVSEEDEPGIAVCAEAGVAAYHMRGQSLDDLMAAIRKVAAGEVVYPPSVSAALLSRASTPQFRPPRTEPHLTLTVREAQILDMLELGRSNRQIAARLDIAVHTVKNHVHTLLAKLGVSTRGEAAAYSHALRANRNQSRN